MCFLALSISTSVTIDNNEKQSTDRKFLYMYRNGKHDFVRCNACFRNTSTVKLHAKYKYPAIATETGTQNRDYVVNKHFEQEYHKKCVKIEKEKLLQIPQKSSMITHMNVSNERYATHVCKLLTQVYNDAKKLTLSAFSWPSRFISNAASNAFSYNNSEDLIPKNMSLQYVTPAGHLDLLSCIVESGTPEIKEIIKSALALSVRIDGSIDRTQKDKLYVLAVVVTLVGSIRCLFLGVAEQTERGAAGHLNAVLRAMENNYGREFMMKYILPNLSSVCTDGANVNIGERGGLWKLLEDKIEETGSEIFSMKIWCAAHRSDLAFGDLENEHPEITAVLNVLSSIASYYHTSAIRTKELAQIAEEKKLGNKMKPKLFKVRWTQYTHRLLLSMLVSWKAMILHLEDVTADAKEKKALGFLKFLKSFEKLQIITFLYDLLCIFKRLQKKLQSRSLTLVYR